MIPIQNHQKKTTTIYVNRADGTEKHLLSVKICGTKCRGINRTKHLDRLNNFVTRKESPNNELIGRAGDKADWKAIIADVCKRFGT